MCQVDIKLASTLTKSNTGEEWVFLSLAGSGCSPSLRGSQSSWTQVAPHILELREAEALVLPATANVWLAFFILHSSGPGLGSGTIRSGLGKLTINTCPQANLI